MNDYNGFDFVEDYVTSYIRNGASPVPLNSSCLVRNLFSELHGKPNTVDLLAQSVVGNCDVLLLPQQLTDEEQLYAFLMTEMDTLEGMHSEITAEYVSSIKQLSDFMLNKYSGNRNLLVPIVHRYALTAMFAEDSEVIDVFTRKEAYELLKKHGCIISYMAFIRELFADIDAENSMWCADLIKLLTETIGGK
jgi:hypothetical protein